MPLLSAHGSFDVATTDSGNKVIPLPADWSAEQPKLVFFSCSGDAATSGQWSPHLRMSFGAAVPGTNFSMAQTCRDAVTTTDVRHAKRTSDCLVTGDPDGGLGVFLIMQLPISQTNGNLTVTIASPPLADTKVFFYALGGDILQSANVVQYLTPATIGTDDLTGFGFQPDAIFVFSVSDSRTPGAFVSLPLAGFGASTGPAVNWGTAQSGRSSQAASEAQMNFYDDACIVLKDFVGTIVGLAGVDSFLADGVRFNWISTAPGFHAWVVGVKGPFCKAGIERQPTANGAQNLVAGQSPKGGLFISNNSTQLTDTTPDINQLRGMTDGTNSGSCFCFDQQGATTTNCKNSIDTANAMRMVDTTQATKGTAAASVQGMNLQLNWAGVDGTERIYGYMLFAEGPPDAPPLPTGIGQRRRRMAGARR